MGNGEAVGFYTTRWVKAKTPELAEKAAIALVKNDKVLNHETYPQKNDPPMVHL